MDPWVKSKLAGNQFQECYHVDFSLWEHLGATIGIHVAAILVTVATTPVVAYYLKRNEIVHRTLYPELSSESQFSRKITEHACIRILLKYTR